jgi:hypothetical protein
MAVASKGRMLTGSIQVFGYSVVGNQIKYQIGVFYPTPLPTTIVTDVDTQVGYTIRVPPDIQQAKSASHQLNGTLELIVALPATNA